VDVGDHLEPSSRWIDRRRRCQVISVQDITCIRYADNILKGFATSVSIIVSCLASVVIFDFEITVMFVIGALFVLYGIVLKKINVNLL
jgi:hypothetical protein